VFVDNTDSYGYTHRFFNLPTYAKINILHSAWLTEGEKRYGKDKKLWRFMCPICNVITAGQEWIDASNPDHIGRACIGRSESKYSGQTLFTKNRKPIGCDYASWGLFNLSPINVIYTAASDTDKEDSCGVFDFADQPLS